MRIFSFSPFSMFHAHARTIMPHSTHSVLLDAILYSLVTLLLFFSQFSSVSGIFQKCVVHRQGVGWKKEKKIQTRFWGCKNFSACIATGKSIKMCRCYVQKANSSSILEKKGYTRRPHLSILLLIALLGRPCDMALIFNSSHEIQKWFMLSSNRKLKSHSHCIFK